LAKKKQTLDLKRITKDPGLKPVYADRSTLERYATCPFQARAVESGTVTDRSHLADVGIEGHRLLAEATEAAGDSYLEAADWLQQELPLARPDLQPEVIAAMKGVASTFYRIRADRILGVEQQFSTEFLKATDKRGPVILTTRVDLWLAGKQPDEVHVHDYKTGWKRRSNSEAAQAFQTHFIAWVLWKVMEDIQGIHFWYEQTRYGEASYCKMERERDFYNCEGRIQSTVALWLGGNKEAWPGVEKCSWCPATAMCPHVVSESLSLNDDPEAYLASYITTKARCGAMEKAMKAYCKAEGEIRCRQNVFGYKEPMKRVTFSLYEEAPEREEGETVKD